jgi:hypothetical protein
MTKRHDQNGSDEEEMNRDTPVSGIHTGCSERQLQEWVEVAKHARLAVFEFVPPDCDEEAALVSAFGSACPLAGGRWSSLSDLVSGLESMGRPIAPSLLVIRDTSRIGPDITWDAFGALVDVVEHAIIASRRLVVALALSNENDRTLGVLNRRRGLVSRHPLSQEVQPPGSRIPAIDHRYDDWPDARTPESAELSAGAVAAGRSWLLLPNSLHLGLSAGEVDRLASGACAVGGAEIVLDLADVIDEPSLMVVLSGAFHTVVPAIDVTAAISLIDLDDLDVEPECLVTVRSAGHLHGQLLDALVHVLLSTCDRMRSGGRVVVCAFEASGNSAEILDLAAAWNQNYYTRSIDYGRPDDLRPIPVVDHR